MKRIASLVTALLAVVLLAAPVSAAPSTFNATVSGNEVTFSGCGFKPAPAAFIRIVGEGDHMVDISSGCLMEIRVSLPSGSYVAELYRWKGSHWIERDEHVLRLASTTFIVP